LAIIGLTLAVGQRTPFRLTAVLSAIFGQAKEWRTISAEGGRLLVCTATAIRTRVCEVPALQPLDAEAETVTVQRDWARGLLGPTKTPESKRTRQAPDIAGMLLGYAKAHGIGRDQFIFGRPDQDGLPPDDRDLQQHAFRPAAERAAIYSPGSDSAASAASTFLGGNR